MFGREKKKKEITKVEHGVTTARCLLSERVYTYYVRKYVFKKKDSKNLYIFIFIYYILTDAVAVKQKKRKYERRRVYRIVQCIHNNIMSYVLSKKKNIYIQICARA